MEQISMPNFVSGEENSSVLTRFELFSATVDSLVRQREHGVDIMISLMKTLAYTRPIPGLTYLNGLFDLLKDLVFHLHSVNCKRKKTVSMDFSSLKQDIFPEDVRENLNKILHLQSLLKKEHEKCVKMFESNAFTFSRLESEIEESERKMIEFRHIPFEDRTDKDDSRFHFHYTRARLNKLGLQQVVSSSKKMVDREQVIQDQLKTLSAQLAILTENQMRRVLKSYVKQLLKIAEDTEANRDLLDEIRRIKPGTIAHQMYVEASDIYAFPAKPQNLEYCPDCGFCIIKGTDNVNMYHYINANGANTNNSATTDNMNGSWQAGVYMKTEMKYKSKNERELKLSKGETVKSKLASSDSSCAFGWKRSFASKKKTWGFFPTIVASRVDEGSYSQPLL